MPRNRIILFLLLFLVSLCSRVWLTVRYMDLGSDKCYQMLAAKNMDEGQGYSISVQNADNPVETIYGPLSGWPPGYSLTISLAQKITGDYFTAAILLDVLSVVVFYSALLLFFLWWGSRFKSWMVNLLLVFWGLSSAPFYMLFSTDFLSLSFFILSSVVFLRWLETGRSNNILLVVFLITAMLPGFFRYGFYPLMFVYPACLMALAIVKKDRKYALLSVATGVVFLAFIGLYSYYQLTLNGQASYMSGDRHGKESSALFFENLRYFNPFFFNSILHDGFIVNRLGGILLISYSTLKALFSLLVIVLIFRVTLRRIRSDENNYLAILTLSTVIVNVLFLALLSVKYKLDTNADGTWHWTYVQEFRYFSPSYFMFLLLLLREYQAMGKIEKGFIHIAILPLMLVGILYSSYTIVSGNTIGTYKHRYKLLTERIEELKKHTPDNNLVIVNGWSRELDNTAYGSLMQLYGYKVYHDFGANEYARKLIADPHSKMLDNNIDKIWNVSLGVNSFDTVFYMGSDSLLKTIFTTPEFNVTNTPVEHFYSITATK
jgi:hypothetical protein